MFVLFFFVFSSAFSSSFPYSSSPFNDVVLLQRTLYPSFSWWSYVRLTSRFDLDYIYDSPSIYVDFRSIFFQYFVDNIFFHLLIKLFKFCRFCVQTERSAVTCLSVHDRDHVQRVQSVFAVRLPGGLHTYVAWRRMYHTG